MNPLKDARTSSDTPALPEAAQAEIDRRLFHLKTLYDVSHELLGVAETETILKNFLLMTLGNFGVVEGFILTHGARSTETSELVDIGFQEEEKASLLEGIPGFLEIDPPANRILAEAERGQFKFLPPAINCVVRFSVDENCAGILGLGAKIVEEPYSDEDKNLLETLVNNLIISLKHARSAEALKSAYEELSILNRAKDKLINHLAHELQTPIAVLKTSVALLRKKLASEPEEEWQRTFARAERHLARLADMQTEVEDILENPTNERYPIVSRLIDQCSDELEVLLAEQIGETPAIERIRQRIEEIYGPRKMVPEDIMLDQFVKAKIKQIQPAYSHRQLNVTVDTERTAPVRIPSEALEKLIIGLMKNAIEYTPDQGKIEVAVRNKDGGVAFVVHDFGVGIVETHRLHIFEGFFPTQETDKYSTKKPYDFNAGGKGADLLRLKIFSERFNFNLDVSSSRCTYIPLDTDICPGKISQCEYCQSVETCYHSGETTFTALFQPPSF